MTETAITQEQFSLLIAKMDRIEAHMAEQQRRQQEMEELQRDLIPIGNHMVKLAIDELAEIGSDFQSEDLFFLLKRLLRDTHLLTKLLDQLENAMEFGEDFQYLGKQIFNQGIEELDRMEQQGYFAFARESWKIIERIMTEFSAEDVSKLGDNAIAALKTVQNVSQPEVMEIANRSINAFRQNPAEDKKVSIWQLIQEMGSPEARNGMFRMIQLLKAMGEMPDASH